MKTNSTQNRFNAALVVWALLLIVGVGMNSTAQAQYTNNGGWQNDRNDRNQRGRNWDNYGNYGGSFDLRQTALNAGYNEGMKDGTSAREKGRNAGLRNQNAYRKANKDYSSRLGNRDLYSRYFREAYETGFNDGFYPDDSANNGNGNWDRNNNGNWDRNNNGNGDRNNNGNGDRNNNGNWDRNNRRGRNWDRYDNYGGSFDLRQTALNAGYNEGIKEARNDRNRNNRSDFHNKSAYQKATTDYSSKLGDRGLYQRYYREGYENGYYDGINGN
ncbi:MAG: hypothetical protein ABJC10_07630 [Acidobacteriota bacterium]